MFTDFKHTQFKNGVIINADCLDVMNYMKEQGIKADLCLTDPPYPDYLAEKYFYHPNILDFLDLIQCKSLVFWSAKCDFNKKYTAVHIWDKKCGVGSMYEKIYEINGGKNYKVYRHYLINSTVAASYSDDTFENHPSQKPVKLIAELLNEYSKENDLILDSFAGSMTTAIACIKTNRRFICIEKDAEYYEKGVDRVKQFDDFTAYKLF